MFRFRFCLQRASTALLLIILVAVQGSAQDILQSTPSCEAKLADQQVASLSPEVEALIRRYTSTIELKEKDHSAGKIRMVWLHPTLVDAIVNEYGTRNHLSQIELARIKRTVKLKLQGPHYMPFLLLMQPESDARSVDQTGFRVATNRNITHQFCYGEAPGTVPDLIFITSLSGTVKPKDFSLPNPVMHM